VTASATCRRLSAALLG
jgi:hypothetical protein